MNAQKEVEDISRRTVAGLNRARAEGRILGAPRVLNDDQVDAMRELHRHGKSKRALAKTFGVGRATVGRYLTNYDSLGRVSIAVGEEEISLTVDELSGGG